MRHVFISALFLIIFLICTGCTGNNTPAKSSYTVDSAGVLSLTCAPEKFSEEVLFSNDTYTKSRIVFRTESGNVTTYLGSPNAPKAAAVYAPGAGENLAGHEERMIRFASAGYAFLFVDTRGNGGETAGIPFGQQLIQQDYIRFEKWRHAAILYERLRSGICTATADRKIQRAGLCNRFQQRGSLCSCSCGY